MDREEGAHIYTVLYYSAIRRKQTVPFATAWMELEGLMLSDIRQAEKDKYQMIFLICGVLNQSKSEGTKQQQPHRLQEATSVCQRGGVWQGEEDSGVL